MLTSALRLVGHKWLDPIFIAGCGLGQSCFTVFKSMKGKKPFFKLTMEDIIKRKEQGISIDEVSQSTMLVKGELSPERALRSNNLVVP